eukprot:TRINITY_DN51997_c0_g1_i2.p1 TRINITY_DN51997_c0_g1~~TRINITY_DN51997_c0_g1_i2.p1  ORF type:complete len:386 (+),score=60.53 TRINITY_DN51997_c0_g1_i2:61-1158(+)
MSTAPHIILCDLHGQVLRGIADLTNVHFQGLAQAARALRQDKAISNKSAKKLAHLDIAYNLTRHITNAYADSFLGDITKEIKHNARSRSVPKAPAPLHSTGGCSSDDASSDRCQHYELFEKASCDDEREFFPDFVLESGLNLVPVQPVAAGSQTRWTQTVLNGCSTFCNDETVTDMLLATQDMMLQPLLMKVNVKAACLLQLSADCPPACDLAARTFSSSSFEPLAWDFTWLASWKEKHSSIENQVRNYAIDIMNKLAHSNEQATDSSKVQHEGANDLLHYAAFVFVHSGTAGIKQICTNLPKNMGKRFSKISTKYHIGGSEPPIPFNIHANMTEEDEAFDITVSNGVRLMTLLHVHFALEGAGG